MDFDINNINNINNIGNINDTFFDKDIAKMYNDEFYIILVFGWVEKLVIIKII